MTANKLIYVLIETHRDDKCETSQNNSFPGQDANHEEAQSV
jgi:hypothetical protein